MALLRITPEKLISLCRELDEVSQHLDSDLTTLNCLMEKLNASWEGVEQIRYSEMIKAEAEKSEELVKTLKSLSSDLQSVSEIYRQSEVDLTNSLTCCIIE